MRITGKHFYFDLASTRRKHGRVPFEEGARVARQRRVWIRLRSPEDEPEGLELVSYSPRLGSWVFLIVLSDGRLFNGYCYERDEAEEFIRRVQEGR